VCRALLGLEQDGVLEGRRYEVLKRQPVRQPAQQHRRGWHVYAEVAEALNTPLHAEGQLMLVEDACLEQPFEQRHAAAQMGIIVGAQRQLDGMVGDALDELVAEVRCIELFHAIQSGIQIALAKVDNHQLLD